jgi:biotin transport system substrate-specific component
MTHTFSLSQPLQSIFLPTGKNALKSILMMLIGTVLLAASAQLAIPFQPVPLTFQSITVVLIGLAYGSRLGMATVMSYLVAGAIGFPVFAEFYAGFGVFMGPTGGYLIGFLPAAGLCGYLAENGWGRGFLSSFTAGLLAVIVIFAFGVTRLSQLVGWQAAWMVGIKPFLFTELLKLVVLAIIAKNFWKAK